MTKMGFYEALKIATIFKISFEYYFFGSVAFKVNANNPAGINPVVNNNLN